MRQASFANESRIFPSHCRQVKVIGCFEREMQFLNQAHPGLPIDPICGRSTVRPQEVLADMTL